MISISELCIKNYQAIYEYVHKFLKNKDDAQDITQQTILNILINSGNYNTSRPFINWAITIAKNECIDFKRKEIRDRKNLYDLEMNLPITYYIEHSKKIEIDLEGKYRLIWELRNIGGIPIKEIASISGMPSGTVLWVLDKIKNSTSLGHIC